MTWTVYNPTGETHGVAASRAAALSIVAPRQRGATGRNTAWVAMRRAGWSIKRTGPLPRRAKQTVDGFREQVRAERALAVSKVLEAAVLEAKDVGYQWITREAVAKRAGVSNASVSNAFGGMVALKRKVMAVAVERPIPEIVAQGLADGSTIAAAAPREVKEAASATLIG